MSGIDPTVPDHWMEREPERFEDMLFVSEEVYTQGLFEGVAKEYIAVYSDGITIEYNNKGSYSFYHPETDAEATDRIDAIMRL